MSKDMSRGAKGVVGWRYMAPPPPKRPLNTDDLPDAPPWLEKLLGAINAFIRPTSEALDRGLTYRENFAGQVVQVQVTPPDDWVPLTLENSWTAIGAPWLAPAYRQTLDGEVVLRGAIERAAGVPAVGSNMASGLPALASYHRFAVDTNTGTYGGVQVTSAGVVQYESGGVAITDLSSIRALAADRTPPRWATPIDVRLGTPQRPFPGRPGYVRPLAATVTGGPGIPAPVTWIDWGAIPSEGGRGASLRIHRVWGLAPGVAYTLTLLVLPE